MHLGTKQGPQGESERKGMCSSGWQGLRYHPAEVARALDSAALKAVISSGPLGLLLQLSLVGEETETLGWVRRLQDTVRLT